MSEEKEGSGGESEDPGRHYGAAAGAESSAVSSGGERTNTFNPPLFPKAAEVGAAVTSSYR